MEKSILSPRTASSSMVIDQQGQTLNSPVSASFQPEQASDVTEEGNKRKRGSAEQSHRLSKKQMSVHERQRKLEELIESVSEVEDVLHYDDLIGILKQGYVSDQPPHIQLIYNCFYFSNKSSTRRPKFRFMVKGF